MSDLTHSAWDNSFCPPVTTASFRLLPNALISSVAFAAILLKSRLAVSKELYSSEVSYSFPYLRVSIIEVNSPLRSRRRPVMIAVPADAGIST